MTAAVTAARWYLRHALDEPDVLAAYPVPEAAMAGARERALYRALLADLERCGEPCYYRIATAMAAQASAGRRNASEVAALADLLAITGVWVDWPEGLPEPAPAECADLLLAAHARELRRAELMAELRELGT